MVPLTINADVGAMFGCDVRLLDCLWYRRGGELRVGDVGGVGQGSWWRDLLAEV